jgi:Protein of unknown function (DUF1570)
VLDFPARFTTGVSAMKAIVLRCVRTAALIAGLRAPQRVSFAANAQSWIEVRSPHFIVISNANEHDARGVTEQFETIRAVYQGYLKNVSTNDQAIIIIAARDEDTLKPLLAESFSKKGAMHPAGIYLNGPDKSYVGLRLDASVKSASSEPYKPIYHEYFHYLTRGLIPKLPLWMVEGLAEFYGTIRFEGNDVVLGAPSTSSLMILRQTMRLPLSTLLEVNASSPYYNEQNKVSIFYAESWALTHYLTLRDWREKTHRLNDFFRLLQQNVSQVEAARRTIGDPEVLEKALDEYVLKFSFTAAHVDKPKIEVGNGLAPKNETTS